MGKKNSKHASAAVGSAGHNTTSGIGTGAVVADDLLFYSVVRRYDPSGSGKVNASKLKHILHDLFFSMDPSDVYISDDTAAKVLEIVDIDGNRKCVSLSELKRWWHAHARPLIGVVAASHGRWGQARGDVVVDHLVDVPPGWVSLVGRLTVAAPYFHTRVHDLLNHLAAEAEAQKTIDMDNVSNIIGAMCSAAGMHNITGDISKFGDDLKQPNANSSALNCPEIIPADFVPPSSVEEAMRAVGIQRGVDYAMCCSCSIICGATKVVAHLQAYHTSEVPSVRMLHSAMTLGELNASNHSVVKFKHPTVEDILQKGETFWARFQGDGLAQKYPNVTRDCAVALYFYTLETELYRDMNYALRVGLEDVIARFRPFIHYLQCAFEQLPKHDLMVSQLYRGLDVNLEATYSSVSFVRWTAFSSTTASHTVVQEFIHGVGHDAAVQGTIFLIRSRNGILISDFSEFPKEDEVLLPPNSLLKIGGEVGTGTKELLSRQLGLPLTSVYICEVRDATEADVREHYERISTAESNLWLQLTGGDNIQTVQKLILEVDDGSLSKESLSDWMSVRPDFIVWDLFAKLTPRSRAVALITKLGLRCADGHGLDIVEGDDECNDGEAFFSCRACQLRYSTCSPRAVCACGPMCVSCTRCLDVSVEPLEELADKKMSFPSSFFDFDDTLWSVLIPNNVLAVLGTTSIIALSREQRASAVLRSLDMASNPTLQSVSGVYDRFLQSQVSEEPDDLSSDLFSFSAAEWSRADVSLCPSEFIEHLTLESKTCAWLSLVAVRCTTHPAHKFVPLSHLTATKCSNCDQPLRQDGACLGPSCCSATTHYCGRCFRGVRVDPTLIAASDRFLQTHFASKGHRLARLTDVQLLALPNGMLTDTMLNALEPTNAHAALGHLLQAGHIDLAAKLDRVAPSSLRITQMYLWEHAAATHFTPKLYTAVDNDTLGYAMLAAITMSTNNRNSQIIGDVVDAIESREGLSGAVSMPLLRDDLAKRIQPGLVTLRVITVLDAQARARLVQYLVNNAAEVFLSQSDEDVQTILSLCPDRSLDITADAVRRMPPPRHNFLFFSKISDDSVRSTAFFSRFTATCSVDGCRLVLMAKSDGNVACGVCKLKILGDAPTYVACPQCKTYMCDRCAQQHDAPPSARDEDGELARRMLDTFSDNSLTCSYEPEIHRLIAGGVLFTEHALRKLSKESHLPYVAGFMMLYRKEGVVMCDPLALEKVEISPNRHDKAFWLNGAYTKNFTPEIAKLMSTRSRGTAIGFWLRPTCRACQHVLHEVGQAGSAQHCTGCSDEGVTATYMCRECLAEMEATALCATCVETRELTPSQHKALDTMLDSFDDESLDLDSCPLIPPDAVTPKLMAKATNACRSTLLSALLNSTTCPTRERIAALLADIKDTEPGGIAVARSVPVHLYSKELFRCVTAMHKKAALVALCAGHACEHEDHVPELSSSNSFQQCSKCGWSRTSSKVYPHVTVPCGVKLCMSCAGDLPLSQERREVLRECAASVVPKNSLALPMFSTHYATAALLGVGELFSAITRDSQRELFSIALGRGHVVPPHITAEHFPSCFVEFTAAVDLDAIPPERLFTAEMFRILKPMSRSKLIVRRFGVRCPTSVHHNSLVVVSKTEGEGEDVVDVKCSLCCSSSTTSPMASKCQLCGGVICRACLEAAGAGEELLLMWLRQGQEEKFPLPNFSSPLEAIFTSSIVDVLRNNT